MVDALLPPTLHISLHLCTIYIFYQVLPALPFALSKALVLILFYNYKFLSSFPQTLAQPGLVDPKQMRSEIAAAEAPF